MDTVIVLRRALREVEWKLFLLYRGGVWDDLQEQVLWAEVDRLEGELSEALG